MSFKVAQAQAQAQVQAQAQAIIPPSSLEEVEQVGHREQHRRRAADSLRHS